MFEPVLTEGGSNIILQMISRDDNAEKRFLHHKGNDELLCEWNGNQDMEGMSQMIL